MTRPERKGLRFEIRTPPAGLDEWTWELVGKDDEVYVRSARSFEDEADCRSNIAKCRKVFKGSGYAKVVLI